MALGGGAMGGELRIERPGLALRHWPAWLPPGVSAELLASLKEEVPWKQEAITLYGRRHLLPRLTCWMADPGCGYRYSGLANVIETWSPAASKLRQALEEFTGWRFNSLLLNRYRDGRDAMGWHADDEPELDSTAAIASLSLGASRDFRLRPRPSPCRPQKLSLPEGHSEAQPFNIPLHHGDLLLMEAPSQWWWQHALPRRLRLQQERFNLTFRVVRPNEPTPSGVRDPSAPLEGNQA